MNKQAHIKRHQELHKSLDELVADFITHTEKSLSETNILTLVKWSHQETLDPTEED